MKKVLLVLLISLLYNIGFSQKFKNNEFLYTQEIGNIRHGSFSVYKYTYLDTQGNLNYDCYLSFNKICAVSYIDNDYAIYIGDSISVDFLIKDILSFVLQSSMLERYTDNIYTNRLNNGLLLYCNANYLGRTFITRFPYRINLSLIGKSKYYNTDMLNKVNDWEYSETDMYKLVRLLKIVNQN